MAKRPQKIMVSALLLALSLAGSAAFAGEKGYYKWQDARGKLQLSDRPPPNGIEYEFVSDDSGLSRRMSADEPRADNLPSSTAQPTEIKDTRNEAEKRTTIEKNPALCDQAKGNLDTLNSKARVRIRDADGSIRYLSEAEKEEQRQKARDLSAVHCS